MNRNQYLAFKKEISIFDKESLIELAIALRALLVAFKRFWKILNINQVVSEINDPMKRVVEFLKKYDSFDQESVYKLLSLVDQQIGESYYVEVKAFSTILEEAVEIAKKSLGDDKVIDGESVNLVGLKVKTVDKIYNRDLDRDLEKLLGKSL